MARDGAPGPPDELLELELLELELLDEELLELELLELELLELELLEQELLDDELLRVDPLEPPFTLVPPLLPDPEEAALLLEPDEEPPLTPGHTQLPDGASHDRLAAAQVVSSTVQSVGELHTCRLRSQ